MEQLPEDFASLVLRALDPQDAQETAALIAQAAALPEPALRSFLDLFAERVRASPAPVRAAEIRSWLAGPAPGA